MSDPMRRFDLFSQLTTLADRLQSNPDYMAWVLRAYSRAEGLAQDRLLLRLRTSADMLTRLAICKRPVADSPRFAAQVLQISDYTAIDAGLLANVIRQVDSLASLATMPTAQEAAQAHPVSTPVRSGLMAAARDRVQQDEEEPTAPNGQEATEEKQ